MANKMLIDATHPEETRVVVLRGNRVEEFDFESAHRKQLRGNIYLAKVTRVEPSLQAAFVDYGGNRHGFLAFSEIHPDYYQIPVADRQALIDEEERAQRAADDEVDRRSRRPRRHGRSAQRRDAMAHGELAEDAQSQSAETLSEAASESGSDADDGAHTEFSDADANAAETPSDITAGEIAPDAAAAADGPEGEATPLGDMAPDSEPLKAYPEELPPTGNSADEAEAGQFHEGSAEAAADSADAAATIAASAFDTTAGEASGNGEPGAEPRSESHSGNGDDEEAAEDVIESVGGADAMEEVPDRAPRYRRQYKIQEVIKRRQVMLVQVVKEERGTKGAALTTYLSLAGRYSVLMPNTARGGGISRKITSAEDRARLKEAAAELEVPEGMGVILRTAGANRTKIEIKRDFEYLLRMWETVRDLTLKSTAPKLVYEEGSLVKRSIRDLYSKDIDEVTVAGSEAYHEAKDFMRMLMPSHARNVHLYNETQPLLSRYGVENQLDAMFSPVVQLRSGGYIVLNQAEALVAIDVNSGRATREHHIEDTALKTNLEAADEIARQLRLRDLAGLIVIDFIDMDEKRNNRSVERRLKECLKHDRARIQVGRISHFGLLEMSRQRIRTSVLESSTEKCPYCGGSGHVRSVSSLALQVLRALEEQLIRGGMHNLIARTRPDVALYVLNQKRAHLRGLEERFAIAITISADESVHAPQAFIIERGEQIHTAEAAKAIAEQSAAVPSPLEEEDDLEEIPADEGGEAEAAEEAPTVAPQEHGEGGPRRRRRRRRRGGRNGSEDFHAQQQEPQHGAEHDTQPHEAIDLGDDQFRHEGDAIEQEQEADASPAGDSGPDEQQPAESAAPEHEGERQRDGARRRRGRRGGRRNRHRSDEREHAADEREFNAPSQESAAPGDDAADHSPEPDLTNGVAEFAATPRSVSQAPVAEEAPQPAAPEPPARRRSTVRERAPVTSHDDAAQQPSSSQQSFAPAAEPVVTDTGGVSEAEKDAEADRPRRTGWWSRRFAGG